MMIMKTLYGLVTEVQAPSFVFFLHGNVNDDFGDFADNDDHTCVGI